MSLDIGALYAESRRRTAGVIAAAGPDAGAQPVAACPGWVVKDVVAHLVGVIEDAAAGRITGIPRAEQTSAQVARHRDESVDELVARWEHMAPLFEAVLTAQRIVPAFLDALSHEHDVRAALGRPGDRDDRGVAFAARQLAEVDGVPVRIELTDASAPSPTRCEDGTYVLRATPFEVLRLRLGRRSTEQVRAMRWSADPAPILPALFVFGPAAVAFED